MGSRGSFLEGGGFSTPAQWHTVGYENGIKVLRPKDPLQPLSLPPRSNTPGTTYLLYSDNGELKQIRVFGPDRVPQYDIDYHLYHGKMWLHKHNYINGERTKEHLPLSSQEYAKYSRFLKKEGE